MSIHFAKKGEKSMAKRMMLLSKCGKEIMKTLIDRDMDINDLAEGVGYSREYVSRLISGRVNTTDGRRKLCEYLEIPYIAETLKE